MKRKGKTKPYWEMTAQELADATRQFDEEFVADRAKPMSAQMRARWERAKAKSRRGTNGEGEIISVRLNKGLLDQCNALAKKRRLSRDALIERGLRVLLDAEG